MLILQLEFFFFKLPTHFIMLHTKVWWMSGVVNVAFYIGVGKCRGWWMSGWWKSHNRHNFYIYHHYRHSCCHDHDHQCNVMKLAMMIIFILLKLVISWRGRFNATGLLLIPTSSVQSLLRTSVQRPWSMEAIIAAHLRSNSTASLNFKFITILIDYYQ